MGYPKFIKLTSCGLLSLILLFLSACTTFINPYPLSTQDKRIFPPEQLRADLKAFDKALRDIHPEPFARLDVDEYQSQYDQLYLDLFWPQRRSNFYRLLTPLVSKLADTHTRVIQLEQEYQSYLSNHGDFPLAVLNTSTGLIVVADLQDDKTIPIGAKILSINGINIKRILEKLAQHIPAETATGLRRMIQVEFSPLLASIYQFEEDYKIEYKWGGHLFKAQLQGVKMNHFAPNNSAVSHYGSIDISQEIELIWLNDFNENYDSFEQFLDSTFNNIKQQEKSVVILDLRYNQGGITDNLTLLLTYLSAQPVRWATHATIKLSEQFREQHNTSLKQTKSLKYGDYFGWLPVEYFNGWQWKMLFTDDGDFLETDVGLVVSEKENIFQGKLIVLSNGYCFSACASLIATLENNKLATIIGEEPGSLTRVQYGYPVEVVLPNTGIKVVLPAMKFVLEDEDRVIVLPKNQIERTNKEVILREDPVLDYAIRLSKSHQ